MSAVGIGQAYPVRGSVPGLHLVVGKWTGGGAATSMTVTAGDWSEGIASVAYNSATGLYKVTFEEVGQQLVYAHAEVHRPTSGDDPLPINIDIDSFDRDAMTVLFEVGATLADLDTDEKVTFLFVFARVAP